LSTDESANSVSLRPLRPLTLSFGDINRNSSDEYHAGAWLDIVNRRHFQVDSLAISSLHWNVSKLCCTYVIDCLWGWTSTVSEFLKNENFKTGNAPAPCGPASPEQERRQPGGVLNSTTSSILLVNLQALISALTIPANLGCTQPVPYTNSTHSVRSQHCLCWTLPEDSILEVRSTHARTESRATPYFTVWLCHRYPSHHHNHGTEYTGWSTVLHEV